jgi:hypothetical protein
VNTLELHALKRQNFPLKNEEEIDNYLNNYLARHGLKLKNIKERISFSSRCDNSTSKEKLRFINTKNTQILEIAVETTHKRYSKT